MYRKSDGGVARGSHSLECHLTNGGAQEAFGHSSIDSVGLAYPHRLICSAIIGSYPNVWSVNLTLCDGSLGVGNLELTVHGKYFVIGKEVLSVETAALKIHIQLGT